MVVRGIGREQTVGVPTGYRLVTGSRAVCPVPEVIWGVKPRPYLMLQMGLEQGWVGALRMSVF